MLKPNEDQYEDGNYLKIFLLKLTIKHYQDYEIHY